MINTTYILGLVAIWALATVACTSLSIYGPRLWRIIRSINRPFWDTRDYRTAAHEAGHALTAWAATVVGRVNHITIDPHTDEDFGLVAGVVRYEWSDYATNQSVVWPELVIALGGLAAEMAMFGQATAKASSKDLQHALEYTDALILRGSLTPPWHQDTAQQAVYCDDAQAPFERMFRGGLSNEQLSVLRHGYAMARRVITAYGEQYLRFVKLLVQKRTISEPDMEPIFGGRQLIKFAGQRYGRFILPGDNSGC